MVADITSGCTIRFGPDTAGFTEILVETAATADVGDTVVLTLANYGIVTFLAIDGYVHSTTDSIVIKEEPTTAVSSGVLTVTLTSATNKKRVYSIIGRGAK